MKTNEEQYTIDTTPFRVKVFEPSPGPSGDRLRKYNALKLNIDRQKTIGDIEYDDSILVEYLSKGSGEKVWAVCIQCGKGRWLKYMQYRHLCKSCSKSSEETRKKMSASRSGENHYNFGKHHSEETRKKLSDAKSGENHPMFGKHHSEETRKKMSDAQSGEKSCMYGKHHSKETRKKISAALSGEKCYMYGKHKSEESRIKMSCAHQGITFEEFTGFVRSERGMFMGTKDYHNWRDCVFQRDNYTCQECGVRGVGIEAHHIISYSVHSEPEYSLNIDNGITLCIECHRKIKGREDEFYNKYTAIVKANSGFKDDFLSSSVILEGLREQNGPTQISLSDEFVIQEKSEHQIKISNLVKSIVRQCVTYPPKPHSPHQSTIFDY